jgi:hypothetical protein
MADDTEDEAQECANFGVTITDGYSEEGPRIDVLKGTILTFLREILVKYVREEMPASDATANDMHAENDIENSIRNRVDSLRSQFFCSGEYVCKCRDTEREIDRQIEIWNFLARNTPKRLYDDIIEKIISIISIPVSEASYERRFSRRKRFMGHSRVRSNSDLLGPDSY